MSCRSPSDVTVRPTWFAEVRATAAHPGSLRLWSLVANDGIIATAGVLEGLAGAGVTDTTLVMAATAATVAGMLTAGGAEWAEAAAERDAQLSAAEEEEADLVRKPDEELAELSSYYERKGLRPRLAREVADQLMTHSPLEAQLESEHGILEVMSHAKAVRTGAGAAIAYGVGAAIPLLITTTVPVQIETWAILVAVLLSLTLTSIIGARTGGMKVSHHLVRTLSVGLATMGVSYLVGRIVF